MGQQVHFRPPDQSQPFYAGGCPNGSIDDSAGPCFSGEEAGGILAVRRPLLLIMPAFLAAATRRLAGQVRVRCGPGYG